MGFAVPLFAVLMMIGVTNVATVKSSFYQPSLNPNVVMALWGHAARSSLPGRMLIVAVTMFGALRFGLRSLAETVTPTVSAGDSVPTANRCQVVPLRDDKRSPSISGSGAGNS